MTSHSDWFQQRKFAPDKMTRLRFISFLLSLFSLWYWHMFCRSDWYQTAPACLAPICVIPQLRPVMLYYGQIWWLFWGLILLIGFFVVCLLYLPMLAVCVMCIFIFFGYSYKQHCIVGKLNLVHLQLDCVLVCNVGRLYRSATGLYFMN